MHRKKNIIPLKQFGVCFLLILFLTTGFSALSQDTVKDSITVKKAFIKDTITVKKPLIKDSITVKKTVIQHSPRKATIYSAILPGLGQIYNRKYWKVPLVYGGFVTLGYFINFNNNQYTIYRQAYSDLIDNDPNTNSFLNLKVNPSFLQPDRITQFTDALRAQKDYWRRNRDLLVISTAVFYAVNIIDASVDAHFFGFDIGDNLTINWTPGPIMCMDKKGIGILCKFTF